MRKPIKTALATTTALTEPTPSVGDNSGVSGYVLPLPQDIHHDIETTLEAIATSEKAIEYARQKLAHLLWERHDRMVADKPAGSVPFAHDLAENNAAFMSYLDALDAEFVVADSPKLKAMTPEQREKHRKLVRRRLFLALELFVRLAWFKTHNQDVPCEWNADAGCWDIFPGAFVPPGYKAGGDLLMEADGKTPRRSVQMESEEAGVWYFVTRNRGSGTTINLSLEQFNHAFGKTLAVLRDPAKVDDTAEATPSRQRRAARQAAAKAEVEAEVAKEVEVAVDVADTGTLGQDRGWALTQLGRALTSVEKCLDMQVLADLAWGDMTKDMANSLVTIQMVIDRMNAKPDGKVKSKPAKLAA